MHVKDNLVSCAAVGLAGACGALLRVAADEWTGLWYAGPFPAGTLLCNYAGCFALCWLTAWLSVRSRMHETLVLSLKTGLIGSFTTFSSLSGETLSLFQDQLWTVLVYYLAATILGGLILAWLGFQAGQRTAYKTAVRGREKHD